MQIKNKIFTYPILNKNLAFSNFDNKVFMMDYCFEETNDSFVLKNAFFKTDSETILSLIKDGKAKVCCVLECSYTIYRKTIDLTLEPKDIILNKKDFSDKVDISLFVYATRDFEYTPFDANEDYRGIKFDIEQFQILAADDGFNFKIIHEFAEDSLTKSMFCIIRDTTKQKDDSAYTVDYSKNRIEISFSDDLYKNYGLIKKVKNYTEVFFNLICIPVLTEGFSLCKNLIDNVSDIDEICDSYPWFRSVTTSYKRLNGKDLTKDDFDEIKPLDLAQSLLGKPLGNSLVNLKTILTETREEDE